MSTPLRNSLTRLIVGSVLLSTATLMPTPATAQSPGDVIRIGNGPSEWIQFESFWGQLLNLNGPTEQGDPAGDDFEQPEDPQKIAKKIMAKLKVSNLRLAPIIRLNGSSIAEGTLTNNNDETVRVGSVNFEIFDGRGKLLSTGSAIPEPSSIEPGQSVTFRRQLLTTPPDPSYDIRLSRVNPFTLLGGI